MRLALPIPSEGMAKTSASRKEIKDICMAPIPRPHRPPHSSPVDLDKKKSKKEKHTATISDSESRSTVKKIIFPWNRYGRIILIIGCFTTRPTSAFWTGAGKETRYI
jgi:hypothetical protein